MSDHVKSSIKRLSAVANILSHISNSRAKRERGYALSIVLVLLLLGSLIIPILLNFIDSGLIAGSVTEKKTDELYAAGAGMEDARWQIKNDQLESLFTDPAYDVYDFSTSWSYSLSEKVNDHDVNISIENVWMPTDIAEPDPAEARAIIEAGKLVVTSTTYGASGCTIKLTYYPAAEEDLKVESIGVWLPSGFSYIDGSSNLESVLAVESVTPHNGGQAVLWEFSSVPFTSLPGVSAEMTTSLTSEITFQYNSSRPNEPDVIAWMTTSGVDDIPYSWDADTSIYRILSKASSTTIEAYVARNKLREVKTGICGDYKAIGNSLMVDSDNDGYYRETLLTESDATLDDIPSDATVKAAYLYWSARLQGPFMDTCSNFNNWDDGGAWSTYYGRFRGYYGDITYESDRYLTMSNNLDLSSYGSGTVSVYFTLSNGGTLDSGDGLDIAFSADGGITWSSNYQIYRGPDSPPDEVNFNIPDVYKTGNFIMRFYLAGSGGSKDYLNVDNITIMAPDGSVAFKIDGQQVYFDGDGTPQQGVQEISASKLQVLPNNDGYCYVGYKDVTALVKAFSAKAPDPAVNHPGNATYTVGNVAGETGLRSDPEGSQLAYAGWSLVIIYSSAETEGHSLHLYDTFMHSNGNENIDFDHDGQPGGDISGFVVPDPIEGEVNAAKLTAFVGEGDDLYTGDYLAFNDCKLWDGTTTKSNSESNPVNVWNGTSLGLSADGVDIDTFYITWESNLLQPGDSSAHIDVPTNTDQWNLIYMIVSFRSEPVTGGPLNYLIWNTG